MDNKTPVSDVVAGAAKESGASVHLKAFKRFQLGEGIEKQQTDFAAEVAATAGIKKDEPVA
jgi:elongation factor Ts